jgi:long-chain acyl-CoA synthetase
MLDAQGKDLPERRIGEIALQSDCMLTGYYRRPDLTEKAFLDGWYPTGDLGYLANGELYITGRKKELIIVGGLNVYPGEIERVLVEHPAVLEAAAFGVPDPSRGEAVWAAVVLRPEMQVDVKDLQALCREKLASYKVPRGIEIKTELPKNILGKVQRHLLHQEVVERQDEAEKVCR